MIENQHTKGWRDGEFYLAGLTDLEKELPFHLVGVGYDFYQYPVNRPFGYPVYQWIQTVSGTGILELQGVRYEVPEGYGFLLYPGDAHAYYSADETPWRNHWITINGYHIESMLQYIGLKKSAVFAISDPMVMSSLIHKALNLLKTPSEMTGLEGSVLAYQLLMDLFKYVWNDEKENHSRQSSRLKKVFEQIDRELGTPLTIDHLAETAGVTPQYFCELFKMTTKQRPMEYINRRRIDRAKEIIIRDPHKKLNTIAREVGFESNSYFSTVFRKLEGISPNKFREFNSLL
ncbi:MAG: AraC family transcriptional regulator [Spirochaetales bacterium]|nr:AraC family transcriptional regulator [Spirochaetales bacterium]